MARPLADERETAYVSTGHLPGPETVQSLVNESQRRFKSNRDGTNSQVYGAGDVNYEFSQLPAGRDSRR